MIKFSVIIPVYNTEKYLDECIRSVINQTYKNIEIICVDDGSEDNSHEILREYAKKDERIVAIKQSNKGQSAARNVGIKAATGQYLFFVDSDDFLTKNAMELLNDELEKRELDAICFNAHTIYESEEIKSKYNKDSLFFRLDDYSECNSGSELFIKMMESGEYSSTATMTVVKREWLLENELLFQEGIIYEDLIFSVQCYMYAKRMLFIKDKIYVYRVRVNSTVTNKLGYHNLYSIVFVLKWCLSKINEIEECSPLYLAFIKYVNIIVNKIKKIDREIPKEDKSTYEVSEPFIDLLFKTMGVGMYGEEFDICVHIEGFSNRLARAERIIFYGAGKIGKLYYDYLASQGMGSKVVAFAVTDILQIKDSQLPTPVYSIDELGERYRNDSDCLLIIAAGRELQREMKMKSQECGFCNVIGYDKFFIDYMTEKLR